jgi:hypothetical protein
MGGNLRRRELAPDERKVSLRCQTFEHPQTTVVVSGVQTIRSFHNSDRWYVTQRCGSGVNGTIEGLEALPIVESEVHRTLGVANLQRVKVEKVRNHKLNTIVAVWLRHAWWPMGGLRSSNVCSFEGHWNLVGRAAGPLLGLVRLAPTSWRWGLHQFARVVNQPD